jgi:hypothetical protein
MNTSAGTTGVFLFPDELAAGKELPLNNSYL